MAETFDVRLASEPSFAKATDGRGSAVSLVQTLTEGREHCGGILAVFLRAHRGAEHVVEVRSALRGHDRVAATDVRLVHELLVAAPDERETVPKELFGFAAIIRSGELAVGVIGEGAGRVAVGDGEASRKQQEQLRGQLFRGRLATASRPPPRKLARCPHNVVPHVVHVVSSLEFRHGFLVGA